jgi:arsenate reductase-like glutaredoxin family protein
METILKDNLTKVELIDSIQFESPRYNNDHFTKMIIDYKNYDLAKEENLTRKEMEEILNNKDFLSLPLYIYEHGGLALSTKSQCQWDSSFVGLIYISKKQAKEDGIDILSLKNEIQEFDDYLRNEVYEINIYTTNEEEKEWELQDFSGWIYGYNNALEEYKAQGGEE